MQQSIQPDYACQAAALEALSAAGGMIEGEFRVSRPMRLHDNPDITYDILILPTPGSRPADVQWV